MRQIILAAGIAGLIAMPAFAQDARQAQTKTPAPAASQNMPGDVDGDGVTQCVRPTTQGHAINTKGTGCTRVAHPSGNMPGDPVTDASGGTAKHAKPHHRVVPSETGAPNPQ